HHLQPWTREPVCYFSGRRVRPMQPVAVVLPSDVDGSVADPLHHLQPQRQGEVEWVAAAIPEHRGEEWQEQQTHQPERVSEQRSDDHEGAECAEGQTDISHETPPWKRVVSAVYWVSC
ncbi:MAG: hypothetical protein ACD_41C00070G0001, partial [uncultured bacterium]